VLNWNVWDENPKSADAIVEFIKSHNADIVCLQEVREGVLSAIKQYLNNYEQAFARGMESGAGTCYLVILSKFPIETRKVIPGKPRGRGWSFFRFWKKIREHIESHFVILNAGACSMQVFNVHLEVSTGPLTRIKQFENVLKHKENAGAHIIVGDLNIYADRWYHKFIGWLLFGHSNGELFFNERDLFEKVFKKHGLKNIFKNKFTYSLFWLLQFQFDHIIVSDSIRHTDIHVDDDCGGSDHQPIIAELEI